MQEIQVGKNEAGKRLDKLLLRTLNRAPASLLYKMLRRKTIKLNGKKAEGRELLAEGDCIQLYLSDETFRQLRSGTDERLRRLQSGAGTVSKPLDPRRILYQDADILAVNKPAGVLSQKAEAGDDSINEQILRYLLAEGRIRPEQLQTFSPSVCNRLDRNTSGILLAGVSLRGSRALSQMLKERVIQKYYLALVTGTVRQEAHAEAYLTKDGRSNRSAVSETPIPGSARIETHYRPLRSGGGCTLLEVHLITGKSHQIRAHLAWLGYPVVGDAKYGDREMNRRFRTAYGVQSQCLHAWRIEFPQETGELEQLRGKRLEAPLPERFQTAIADMRGIDGINKG